MPGFDFAGVVPLDANSLWQAVGGFLGLSIVGSLLMFWIGIRLGPALLRAIGRSLTGAPTALSGDDPVEELYQTFPSMRDTDAREELIEEYKFQRAKKQVEFDRRVDREIALGSYHSAGDIGPLADQWDRHVDLGAQDEFRQWLEETTGDVDEADTIGDQISERSYLRMKQRERDNHRAYEHDLEQLTLDTVI